MSELLVSGLRSRSRTERPTITALAGGLGVPLASLGLVSALAASNGGYFPTAWGWSALLLALVAALALILRAELPADALSLVWVGAWTAVAAWSAVAVSWSAVPSQSVLEVERILVYVAAVAAVAALARGDLVPRLLGGTLAGVTAVAAYALGTRLFPDRIGAFDPTAGYRLATPVGYWNGLGVLSAVGAVLALGIAARAAHAVSRAAAAAAAVVLVSTVYFTFSRGSWIALGIGLLASLALSPRRLQLATTFLLTAPFAAAAVWLGTRADALTHLGAPLAQATRDGHRLAAAVALLAVGAGIAAALRGVVEPRLPIPTPLRLAYGALLVLAAAGALAAVFARFGGPVTIAHTAWSSFKAPPLGGRNLNDRLFTFSGNGRVDLWTAAWDDARAHPWLGSGPGTYEPWWYEHRGTQLNVRDAHALYLEELAEVGPLGLALLALALGVPLVAAVKARANPFAAAAFGAYAAWLVHAGVDWDWELTGVTLPALLCGGALVAAAGTRRRRGTRTIRSIGLGLVASLGVFAFVGLGANVHLATAASAAEDGRWVDSERAARAALGWAPWSAEAWQRIAEAQIGRGELAPAAESLRQALAKNPRDWELWLELAEVTDSRRALARAEALNRLAPEVAAGRRAVGGGR